MKKKILRKSISIITVLGIVMSTFLCTGVSAFAAQTSEACLTQAGTGTFEHDNSYLTKEEYERLGFNLKSAESFDDNKDINPLLGMLNQKSVDGTTLKYTGNVKYGWSNPQILSVMLSSPYWDELLYGNETTSAGSTSVDVSSSIAKGETSSDTVDVGVSVTMNEEVTVAGNGITFGAGLNISTGSILENTSEKSTGKDTTLTCGAQTDNVALYVVPMAIYEYDVITDGKTEKTYVQIPLGTVFSTTTLDSYNKVANDVNLRNADNTDDKCDCVDMLIVDMDEIYYGYESGEPSTYFHSKEDFPDSFVVKDNHLVPSDTDAEITGTVYGSNTEYSISGNSNSSGTITYEGSESNGTSHGQSISLGANANIGVKVGADVLGITTQSTVQVEVEGNYSSVVSKSTVNTQTFSSSVEYCSLPSGVKSSYNFTCSQIVWVPDSVNSEIYGCPACIIASTVSKYGVYPPYLPTDVHVSNVDSQSVTLSWTNPNFGDLSSDRVPQYYKVCMSSNGNVSLYNEIMVVSSDCTKATITGLKPGIKYTFSLQSVNSTGTSVCGPGVSVTTNYSDQPIITLQPEDSYVEVGESAVLTTKAQMTEGGSKLSYKWQQLSEDRYGMSFVDIESQTDSTLTLDINKYNEDDIDNTTYRCIVTRKTSDGFISTCTDTATVNVVHKISNYEELCDFANGVNSGNNDYVNGHFILTNDIDISNNKFSTPIGTIEHPFMGTFDGLGHTINGLDIYDASGNYKYNGLFGVVEKGTIKNVNLTNVSVAVAKSETGVICGRVRNGVISNCTTSGRLDNVSVDCTGGIVSYADSSYINRCINDCDVYSSVMAGGVGGICGYSCKGTVFSNCANTGDCDNSAGDNCVAGICGEVQHDIIIRNCYNTGKITSQSSSRYKSYPICSEHSVTVTNCYYSDDSVVVDSKHEYLGEVMTKEQFENGEVTYLLNSSNTVSPVWFQNLNNEKYSNDKLPTLNNNGFNTVYKEIMIPDTYSNYITGDINRDDDISIVDVTLLQNYITQKVILDELAVLSADINKDDVVSISDATLLQAYIVQ